jgi:serpin B
MPQSPFPERRGPGHAARLAGAVLAVFLANFSVNAAEPTESAATAINTLGLELLGLSGGPGDNTAISPFSIQTALVMTYAGAEGETRAQMAEVLHLGKDAVPSFSALQKQITAVPETLTLSLANRLFGQTGYDFRPDYLKLVKDQFGAPLEELNFEKDPRKATAHINAWVEKQTRDRIRNLIPDDALSKRTGLVLVNAIYLKAPWAEAFNKNATAAHPFHFADGKKADVPTMSREDEFGYRKDKGFTAVSLPYVWGDLQFVILLPDEKDGLPALEKKLTSSDLADLAKLPEKPVRLFLPKFKLEPPRLALGETLQKMGMPSAFDVPRGSANFEGIAPRRPNDYLYISEVFHKAFVEIDENGTEAAAATAVVMMRALSMPVAKPEPVEVRVDRPFLFAIQHRPSGACLFLGRVTDPR